MKEKDQNSNDGHGKHVLELTINGNRCHWHQQFITGAEIRKLGNIPPDDEIFLAIKKPWEDEQITDEKQVNLARPEIEHFYSKDKHFRIELIVNLREKLWTQKTISFEQVVVLAYGSYNNNQNKVYTITYDRGPHQNPEGTMVEGKIVFVKNKMIFNVNQADKS
jgi:hypothetical protein